VSSQVAPAPDAAALALVPGLEAGARPLRLERLPGGSVNQSWRVDTGQGRFVLRVDGPSWRRPGVDRAREALLHRAAASAGVAPRLITASGALGAQVCEYIEGRSWQESDLVRPEQLERLGRQLARLHAIEPAPAVASFAPEVCAQEYLRRAGAQAAAATRAQAVRDSVSAAAAQVARAGAGGSRRGCIIHGDLVCGNVLEGTQLWLIDWEYAQLADPIYDVACVLAYYPQVWPNAGRLMAAAGLAEPAAEQRLAPAIHVYQALTWLWQLARGDRPSPISDFRA
jgi:aminoglycoside phosphotransferase (APT) family kinase protein